MSVFRFSFAVAILATLHSLPAHGQSMQLDKFGGGLGQNLELHLQGDPGVPYLVLFDGQEIEWELSDGETLFVDFRFVSVAVEIPGFLGTLDAQGQATAVVPFPDDTRLDPLSISFQAIRIDTLEQVSNHLRVTPSFPEVFEAPLDDPASPFLADGVAAPQPDGSLFLLPTLSPSIESYDQDLEEFETTFVPCAIPLLSAQTVLQDGRVFVSGGLGLDGQPSDLCFLIDPANNTCTPFQMSAPRAGHASALTGDGNVLITGGFETFDLTDILALFAGILNSTELFVTASSSFNPGPTLLEPKVFHTATPTEDGDILVAGGLTLIPIINIPFVSNTAYVYESDSNSFFFLPRFFNTGRMGHSAALLDDGRILLVGGVTIDFTDFIDSGDITDLALTALDSGEAWSDSFLGGDFTNIPGLSAPRTRPAVVPLPGGEALVAGGFNVVLSGDLTDLAFEALPSADIFLPSNAWRATRSMSEARLLPFGTLLDDGTVMILGGGANGPEIYQR